MNYACLDPCFRVLFSALAGVSTWPSEASDIFGGRRGPDGGQGGAPSCILIGGTGGKNTLNSLIYAFF